MADGGARQRLRGILVVGQVAVSLELLIAAGLFVRSVRNAQTIDLGFSYANILNLGMDVSQQAFDEPRGRAFFKEVEDRVRALPGVESASFACWYRSGRTTPAKRSSRRPAGREGPAASNRLLQRRRRRLLQDHANRRDPRSGVHGARQRAVTPRGDHQRVHGQSFLAGPGSDREAVSADQPNAPWHWSVVGVTPTASTATSSKIATCNSSCRSPKSIARFVPYRSRPPRARAPGTDCATDHPLD